jgi:hypothetical protein
MSSFSKNRANKTGNKLTAVTIAPVRVSTVAMNKQCVLHNSHVFAGLCRLCFPARKVHATYCIVICGMSGSTVFLQLSHK